MKKLMLSSLLAILTLAASAQTNTYAMVIEMQNGTKLTIGPNEVKNVTFNNGQLTVTGETIETLVGSAVNQAKEYTDQAAANLKGYIDLATALEQVKGSISALAATVEGNKAEAIQAGKDAAAAAKEAAQNYALDQIKMQATMDKEAWSKAIDISIESLVKTYQLNAMKEIISSEINAAIVNLIQTYNLQKQ